MGNALFTVVVGGIFAAGMLFYFGRPFSAIVVGLAAYFAARWFFVNY